MATPIFAWCDSSPRFARHAVSPLESLKPSLLGAARPALVAHVTSLAQGLRERVRFGSAGTGHVLGTLAVLAGRVIVKGIKPFGSGEFGGKRKAARSSKARRSKVPWTASARQDAGGHQEQTCPSEPRAPDWRVREASTPENCLPSKATREAWLEGSPSSLPYQFPTKRSVWSRRFVRDGAELLQEARRDRWLG